MSKKLQWDTTGNRKFELGVEKGVLYPMANGAYTKGVAWNGLTAVSESPDGADLTDLWADDVKYASLRANENFNFTIEAYTYPDEWAECDGSASPVDGVVLGQQTRKAFGFSFRTAQGSDTISDLTEAYKLHLIYNSTASVSERSYETINDSPDAITFSWECSSTPVTVTGYKPVSCITIDSLKVPAAKMAALEALLYGSDEGTGNDATLPSPDEVIALLAANGSDED